MAEVDDASFSWKGLSEIANFYRLRMFIKHIKDNQLLASLQQ